MSFVYKTIKEQEALSEYQLEKYLDEKAKHEANLAKEAAEKSAKEQVEKAIESLKSDQAKTVEDLKAEFQAELKKAQDQAKADAEALEAKLKTQSFSNTSREERQKTLSDFIMAKLSTEEGEALLKAFALNKKGFATTLDDAGVEKAMLKPTSGGGYVAPELSGIYGEGHDELRLRNVLRVLPTASDVVKFLLVTKDTTGDWIDFVAEGAEKPTINYTSTPSSVEVKKIAGILDVSEEMLDDVVGFRAFIAAELPLALLDVEDAYIMKHSTDGIYTKAEQWVPNGTVTAASNAWDKIVSAATQVRLNKRRPTAAFVSPVGYQELLINKDNEDAYTYPIVLDNNGVLRVGGLAVYSSNVLENGEAVVGDFITGATLWQRKGMDIKYSDEHKDNFAKNIVSIRIEERICVTVNKPDAFVKLNLIATT